MATQKQLKEHFLSLNGALYVWGANCQIITKSLMDSLYKTFGSKTYNKAYYDNKLKAGEGKKGADCSGAIYPISGYDATASNYYSRCTKKGSIDSIPKNKVCLVFKKNSKGTINHVGCYTGDGYVSEMASSQKNYQRKPLAGNGWDLWGFPDFLTDWGTTVSNNTTTGGKNTVKIELNVLRQGDKGEQVGTLQILLKAKGYDIGKYGVDKDFGGDTDKAVRKYQKDNGLEVDGVVGQDTWTSLLK
jgi:hypothetical protein